MTGAGVLVGVTEDVEVGVKVGVDVGAVVFVAEGSIVGNGFDNVSVGMGMSELHAARKIAERRRIRTIFKDSGFVEYF